MAARARAAHACEWGQAKKTENKSQVYHWKFVGRPRGLASISYRGMVNVLISSKQMHSLLLKSMINVHVIDKVFEYRTYGSEKESRHYYSAMTENFDSIKKKFKTVP